MKQQSVDEKENILKDTKNYTISYSERQTDGLSSATRDAGSQQINFQK